MDITTPPACRRLPRALATIVAATSILLATPPPQAPAAPDRPLRLELVRSVIRASSSDPRTLRIPIYVDGPARLDITSPSGSGVTRTAARSIRAGVTVVTIPVYRRAALRDAFEAGRAAPGWLLVVATTPDGETSMLEASIRVRAPRGFIPSSRMLSPMPGYAITSGFGPRWGRLHAGLDIPAPTGTTILAARSGVVTSVGSDYGYGLATVIDHGDYSTFYAHQSSAFVRVGQRVTRGAAIGAVGTSGSTTGAHLHFEVHVGGTPYDPMRWLA